MIKNCIKCFWRPDKKRTEKQLKSDENMTDIKELEAKYSKFTFFELYSVLIHEGHKVHCPVNWYDLAKLADDMKIPVKTSDSLPPLWIPEVGRYDELGIRIYNPSFRIMEDDMISINGMRHLVDSIYFDDKDDVDAGLYFIEDDDAARNMCVVRLENLLTNEKITKTAWELVYMIDSREIIYEKSRWLEYVNK